MTSKHSVERAKERLGLNPSMAEHFIRNALTRGKRIEDYRPGKEREWLEQRNSDGFTVLVYNDYCFIVRDEIELCVTLYSLPQWFGKREWYSNKGRIRNYCKYQKFNRCQLELC